MANTNNNAYALTLACPIKNGSLNEQSYASLTRMVLQTLARHEMSPLAKVPNTYLARFYILNDVFYEGSPAQEDHLQSKYLVFSSNFHGDLTNYLEGFWRHAEAEARMLWQHCVAFDEVADSTSFIAYIKRCQLKTTFFFNGSSGAPLAEQLKALYLKQELSDFVIRHQGKPAAQLQAAFNAWVAQTEPANLAGPTWVPGKQSL